VLFSEPKIPQFHLKFVDYKIPTSFSALQRAENSSIRAGTYRKPGHTGVSVLFSEPKIPQSANQIVRPFLSTVSVLFKFLN